MELLKPDYYDEFTCIADKCTISCCREWKINIDDETYRNWKTIQPPSEVPGHRSCLQAYTMKNNARFADDTTQKEIETMHGHSEAQQRLAQEHSRNCQTLHNKAADGAKIIEAETQSMFGSVEDLIAMGYSGNLEFERDFLGEGLDMINNF